MKASKELFNILISVKKCLDEAGSIQEGRVVYINKASVPDKNDCLPHHMLGMDIIWE